MLFPHQYFIIFYTNVSLINTNYNLSTYLTNQTHLARFIHILREFDAILIGTFTWDHDSSVTVNEYI
jgi:hypothetical protein